MSKIQKNIKIIILSISGIILLIGGIFIMKEIPLKEAEAYILQETKIGLKDYSKSILIM